MINISGGILSLAYTRQTSLADFTCRHRVISLSLRFENRWDRSFFSFPMRGSWLYHIFGVEMLLTNTALVRCFLSNSKQVSQPNT